MISTELVRMRIQILTRSLMRGMGLAAVAIASSLISLPVLAGGATSDSMPKPTSAPTVNANPNTAPALTVPSGNPVPGSVQLTAPTGTAPASTSSEPATPTSEANPTPAANPGQTSSSPATQGTIVEVATSNGSFTTLLAAIKAAGLTEVLGGTGPFTVFAPTDAAFAALPKGTVEALLKPENKEKLRKVLAYHVLAGSVNSSDIKSGQVKTVEGSSVILKTSGGKITVNNARVTDANIQASNGMIHAIDKVILPPDL
jgi:uncharacterized surface protein with fasciclin (FAS1) repeats